MSLNRSQHQPPDQIWFGDDILALLKLDPNETYVPIALLCEQLGLDRTAQERRVRAHAVLASGAKLLLVENEQGSARRLCLRIDLLPLWIASLDSTRVAETLRPAIERYQCECASVLWQSFKPQGYGSEDVLLPVRHDQRPAEQAYVAAQTIALLARQQMLIERQLNAAQAQREQQGADPWSTQTTINDKDAARLAQAVRRVALAAAERTRRNEYAGIYSGLYRQFGIASYRRMPPARLYEALEWLDRWRGDLMGEPEPPPDI